MSNVNYDLLKEFNLSKKDSEPKVEENVFSPLRTIMNLNQRVKTITYHGGKVYLTSLNAMFMARRVSSKTMAYTRVTTELRKFSHQMDELTKELTEKFLTMVYQIAECRKSMRQKKKMLLALHSSDNVASARITELREAYRQDSNDDKSAFAGMRVVICNGMTRLTDLIRIGQNLVVLSKVEAMQAEEYSDVLSDISTRIESSLDKIEIISKAMKQSVV